MEKGEVAENHRHPRANDPKRDRGNLTYKRGGKKKSKQEKVMVNARRKKGGRKGDGNSREASAGR